MKNQSVSLLLSLLLFPSASVFAGNWEQFRGTNGAGISADKNVPIEFGEKSNLLWKVAVQGIGNSSPVVWGDRVFLQSSSQDGKERYLICIEAGNGKTIWTRSTEGQKSHTHGKNTLASSTPVTDGEGVYIMVWDGKGTSLMGYNFKGDVLWTKNLGGWTSQHGPGSSPTLYKDKVIYTNDMDGKSTLIALNKKTGEAAWELPREAYRACYTLPLFLETGKNKSTEMIITSTTDITSYNPDDGSQNWKWKWNFTGKMPLRTIAMTIHAHDMLFASSGDGGGDRLTVGISLSPDGKSAPKTVWEFRKEYPYVPSLLTNGDHLYFVNDKGFAGCADPKTGKLKWFERQPEAKTFTASPVMIDGKMYAASEEGDVYVFDANPQFKLLARNSLGETIRATPAVADGRLLIRGGRHLFCFAKKNK